MLKKYPFFFLFFCSFLLSSESQTKDVVLLSYPRSGNTWMRYCIETLTKRATIWQYRHIQKYRHNKKYANKQPMDTYLDLGVDYSLPFVFKTHWPYPYMRYKEPIILLLRNPKECGSSHGQDLHDLVGRSFFQNLAYFHKTKGEKLLVFYEDLLTNPQKELLRVMEFLSDASDIEERLSTFMDEYEEHKKICISYYSTNEKPTKTADKEKLRYYSQQLSEEELKAFDMAAKQKYPELWETYLKRYEED